MAKARKGRSMKGYLKGNVHEDMSLGTLAATTLVGNVFDEVVNERMLCSSIVSTWNLDNLVAGQGPIVFGVAHSDYSDAEIEAVIENTGSWDTGNLVQSREIGKRLVRTIGTFVGTQGTGTNDIKFAEGRTVKTKLNWMLETGDTLKMWAYNRSVDALSTSAPLMTATGHCNLWKR